LSDDFNTLNPAFHRIFGKEGTDFYGFVVIDEFVSGRGTGGVRFTADVSLDEIARLAREMTLKFAFLRMPSGGAKSGMVVGRDVSAEDRRALSIRFGEAIGDLIREGKYVAGLDMGTNPDDMAAIMSGAGVTDGTGTAETDVDSNYFTALTVFAVADGVLTARGKDLKGKKVLLEGLGKVGSHLLPLLEDCGARIVGASTLSGAIYHSEGLDIDLLSQLAKELGDDCVRNYPGLKPMPAPDLFTQEADLLIPGGAPDSINSSNVGRIAAEFIVPIANIPASVAIEKALHDRGISFVPGFVANSGGVFCWRLSRLDDKAREDMIRRGLKQKIIKLVEKADSANQSIAQAAREVAERNLADMKREEQGALPTRLTSLVKKLSPTRIGYVIGANVFNAGWSRRANLVTRSYFDARYFK
jgi:glutamate dehydrogenase/leucine dehydrogenase